MSHNATGYEEDMNPDMIDGVQRPARHLVGQNNPSCALRAEAIVQQLDPGRIVYHHASGNLGAMHTINFYPNLAPIQEMSDWFEHWATQGVKPVVHMRVRRPFTWDWAMYRGWYKGEAGLSARRGALGALHRGMERPVPRRPGLPDQRDGEGQPALGGQAVPGRQALASLGLSGRDGIAATSTVAYEVIGMYIADNFRAFRTWGLSANSPWEYGQFWKLREGVDRRRKELPVDWDNLQRPGFSADYVDQQVRAHGPGVRAVGLGRHGGRRRP